MTDTTTAVTPATDEEVEEIRAMGCDIRWEQAEDLIARIDAERARNRALVAALETVRQLAPHPEIYEIARAALAAQKEGPTR